MNDIIHFVVNNEHFDFNLGILLGICLSVSVFLIYDIIFGRAERNKDT